MKNDCIEEYQQAMKLLLDSGIISQEAALEQACVYSMIDIVRLLMKSGCNLNNKQALIYACQRSNLEIVELLLNKGCKPCKAALKISCKNSNFEIVKLLLEKSSDPNNNYGLRFACQASNFDIVKLLLKRGCNPYNKHALRYALENSNTQIIDLLFKKAPSLIKCIGHRSMRKYSMQFFRYFPMEDIDRVLEGLTAKEKKIILRYRKKHLTKTKPKVNTDNIIETTLKKNQDRYK